MELLHIEASPRGERSYSSRTAHALIEAYRETHAGATVRTVRVHEAALPAFDGHTLDAKYAILHGLPHTPEQGAAWRAVEKVIEEFRAADHYVFSTPMWNFGLPYQLKHYLDVLLQPGYTFSFSPETGYQGLVTGKPVAVVAARGGEYPAGTPAAGADHQLPHLTQLLGFIGFEDIRPVVVEGTLYGPDVADPRLAAAIEQAREVGKAL